MGIFNIIVSLVNKIERRLGLPFERGEGFQIVGLRCLYMRSSAIVSNAPIGKLFFHF